VAPPQPDPAAATTCADLAEQLPTQVAAQDSRTTTPESALTSAWGDPAIILRCGVAVPAALTATSQLITVNGVDWFPQELTAGYRFTTTGRVANVELSVPDDYAPEAEALVDLAQAVSDTVPLISATP
jgi:hypothetical protein